MTTAKMVTGITALVALAAISTAIYQSKISRESDATAIAVRTERDQLRARLSAMEKRVQQTNGTFVATQNAAPQPAEAPAPTSHNGLGQNPALDYVYTHPETHAAFVEQQVLRRKASYERFFKTSGISAEKQEQLLNAVREQQASFLDLMAMLNERAYSLENMPKDEQGTVLKMVVDMKQRQDAAERATLGEDGYKALHQYLTDATARNVADRVASQLYDSKEPLTGSQAEQLIEILKQNPHNRENTPDLGNRVNGIVINKEARAARLIQETRPGGVSAIDRLEPITDAAIARAQAVLTPAQLAVLKQVQALQATEFQVAPPPAPAAQPAAGGK